MHLFTRENLEQLFADFSKKRILIIGDVMVDAYLWGSVDRISPEAPVPVVAVTRRNNRLGGAANVALNIKAMGATPVLCSVTGRDMKGSELLLLMQDEDLDSSAILQSIRRITTTKFRIFGNNTQMLRVDEETTLPLSPEDANGFHRMLENRITRETWDAIIFQDYDKGLISPELIRLVIGLARQHGIPVAVDPKKANFNAYRNATLFKPNLKEFREGLTKVPDIRNRDEFQESVNQLHDRQEIEQILITLSSDGVFISKNGEGTHLPAHIRSVADVSGAGDTVISVATLGLASGLLPVQLAALGNLAGGIVCEEVGVVPVNKHKLLQEAIRHLV